MAEETAFENGRISNFKGLMTLTFDRVILHTVVNQPSISTYMPNVMEIKVTLCTDRCMHVRMDKHLRPDLLGRLCRKVDLKMNVLLSCRF